MLGGGDQPSDARRQAPAAESLSGVSSVMPSFGERLAERVTERRSQLVLGLDPDPARLWPAAMAAAGEAGSVPASPAARAARAVRYHCELVIEAVGAECVAVKLQLACFERLGAPGREILDPVIEFARERELLVIADAKRGDIDVSARAYAQAFLAATPSPFGDLPGLGADALTVNPLLGADSLAPVVEVARPLARGLFVLVRTSNPGAHDLQDAALRDGGTLSTRIAGLVDRLGAPGIGKAGISDLGAVVGATAPERLEELRRAMPHAPFLLPGIGAQGGRVQDLAAAFAPGPAGGLVAASRGIVAAWEADGQAPAAAAAAEAARLRETAWRLAEVSA